MSERKYGQKGYMEEEPRERGRSAGPRPKKEGPRGRGLGAPRVQAFKCARCGAEGDLDKGVAFDSVCRSCGKDLHSCANCRHFDTSARYECRAGVEERIASKSKRNECGAFEPRIVQGFEPDSGPDGDPKSAFDALFDF